MWPSGDRGETSCILSSFCSFLFLTLISSMLALTHFTHFSFVARGWRLSPFGFACFSSVLSGLGRVGSYGLCPKSRGLSYWEVSVTLYLWFQF